MNEEVEHVEFTEQEFIEILMARGENEENAKRKAKLHKIIGICEEIDGYWVSIRRF